MTANHIARMSAKRLMPKFGDGLPFAVEKVIQSGTAEPGQFVDVGTLAARRHARRAMRAIRVRVEAEQERRRGQAGYRGAEARVAAGAGAGAAGRG